jgi:hypothetical protein
MFRNTAAAIEPPVVAPPAELVPLSVLGLDVSAPATGWEPFLTVRNITILFDDIGRSQLAATTLERLSLRNMRMSAVHRKWRNKMSSG